MLHSVIPLGYECDTQTSEWSSGAASISLAEAKAAVDYVVVFLKKKVYKYTIHSFGSVNDIKRDEWENRQVYWTRRFGPLALALPHFRSVIIQFRFEQEHCGDAEDARAHALGHTLRNTQTRFLVLS